MLRGFADLLDRLLARVLLGRARRRWWLLRFVPADWVRPLLMPAATVVRQDVSRATGIALMIAGATLALVLVG